MSQKPESSYKCRTVSIIYSIYILLLLCYYDCFSIEYEVMPFNKIGLLYNVYKINMSSYSAGLEQVYNVFR